MFGKIFKEFYVLFIKVSNKVVSSSKVKKDSVASRNKGSEHSGEENHFQAAEFPLRRRVGGESLVNMSSQERKSGAGTEPTLMTGSVITTSAAWLE